MGIYRISQKFLDEHQCQLSDVISDFCLRISPGFSPVEIPIAIEPYAQVGSCIKNTRTKASRDSGEILYGWDITWEDDGLIEAECHAVWLSPAGILVDITPRQPWKDIAIFLPQPDCWDGSQFVPNKRQAFEDSPRSRALFMLAEMQDQKKRETWTDQGWVMTKEQNDQFLQRASQIFFGVGKEVQCPCGSGSTFGVCCGRPFGEPWRNF